MYFKNISYLELWRPFVQWSGIICVIVVEGIMRNNSMSLFKFGPVVQEEIWFKIFLIWSSGGPRVQWSGTIYASLKECVMVNIHLKVYEIWTSGSGGGFVYRYFLSGALTAFCLVEWNHLCNFGKGHYEVQFCEIIVNLGQWFRRICL